MFNVGETLTKQIVAEAKKREDDHISSGKLSASMLGNPTQWQVLKWLGVPGKEHDEYTYCKFQRGRDVEDFVYDKLKLAGQKVGSQEKAEYRNTVGLIDIYFEDTGEIIEVKSTTNAAFRFIMREQKAKENHILQACLYALAKGQDSFSLLYVASDDYRCAQFEYNTADYKDQVDSIIDEFESWTTRKEIPEFKPKQKWQNILKYSMYPDWTTMNSSALKREAKKLYESK